MKLLLFALLVMMTACSTTAGEARPWTDATGVVTNETLGVKCSAVAVAPHIVATAAHCLGVGDVPPLAFEGQPAQVLAMGGRVPLTGALSVEVGSTDWALLRVEQEMPWLPTSKDWNQRLRPSLAGGYGRIGTHFSAVNCAPHFMANPGAFILGCAIAPGDSGGPVVVFDPDAVLIGIAIGTDGRHTMVVPVENFTEHLP